MINIKCRLELLMKLEIKWRMLENVQQITMLTGWVEGSVAVLYDSDKGETEILQIGNLAEQI